ncbi:murein biosynthesis integral membrane protein MurJ [Entomobacter blattae]|uniref:Probable lipid II flippase MurJ n=1 Tax=Entomobacter blattae TaxID=2762277 RepID=A0A7H1NRU5_9PROT|nr:murein biosynthesis integral membrane protein MurJ [Entomobacter blattae]QNT78505.1 putative lipid II flippase MurJ [Entomobacter blattae]
MLKGFFSVSSWIMLSRLLGLVRDQLLAAFLGVGPLQDAFQVAFRLPNMFRRLFGEGAFNAAFVPLFSTILKKEGKESAHLFARQSLTMLLLCLGIFCCLGEIFMPGVIQIIAPGFGSDNGRFGYAVQLSRITFPYLVLICAAALVSGVLNSLHYFSIAAAAYVSFNVVGIFALVSLSPYVGGVAMAAAWGVTFSGVIQLGILLFAVQRAAMPLWPTLPVLNEKLKTLFRKMMPGLIGSGITQLNLTVDTIIATLLPTGSVSYMYFADRINQLPLGVLGAAAGTTLLPLLTQELAQNNTKQALQTQNTAMLYAMGLTLPACTGLIFLAFPIMAVLFQHGAFSVNAALLASHSLQAYALGLPAFVMIKVLSPAFFARGDTATPVKVGMATLALNLILNLLFMRPLAHVGPPLASSLAAWGNSFILAGILLRKNHLTPDKPFLRKLGLMAAASLAMGIVLFILSYETATLFKTGHSLLRATLLGGMIAIGALLYGIILQWAGVIKIQTFYKKVVNKVKKR